MKKLSLACIFFLLIMGCGAINNTLVEKRKGVEYYRIFDIKTNADRNDVADAASNGLGRNVNDAKEVRPIPDSAVMPETPGRFKLENRLKNTPLGSFAGGAGEIGYKVATCEGAVWSAKARRTISGQSNLDISACLFQYTKGYHLDLYANFTKIEGGLTEVSRKMASAVVGSPEEWTEKTFLDIVRQIRKQTGAEVVLIEGYPKLSGTPWLDTGEQIKQASHK